MGWSLGENLQDAIKKDMEHRSFPWESSVFFPVFSWSICYLRLLELNLDSLGGLNSFYEPLYCLIILTHKSTLFFININQPDYLSICLSIYLSIDLSIYLSIDRSIYLILSYFILSYLSHLILSYLILSIYLSTYLSIYLSIYRSIDLSIYLVVYLSTYLSIYLSTNQS